METPEAHAPPHPHRRGRRRRGEGLPQWLELAVAVTALVTSVSSIVLAIGSGKTMDKLVKANSIPYLAGGFSDVTPEGSRVLSLDLYNAGVGPAHEKSLRVKVDGRYVRSTDELIAASIGRGDAQRFVGEVTKNGVRTRFIPGGKTQLVFRVPRTSANADIWERLSQAETRWSVDYCYCSVFDECWAVPSKWTEPQPVKQCTRDESHEFQP